MAQFSYSSFATSSFSLNKTIMVVINSTRAKLIKRIGIHQFFSRSNFKTYNVLFKGCYNCSHLRDPIHVAIKSFTVGMVN